MYSVILIAAMTAPADTASWGWRGGCSCSGSSCTGYSCTGHSCTGCSGGGCCGGGRLFGGFLGWRNSCSGCTGSGGIHGAGAAIAPFNRSFGFAGCYGSCYGSYTNFFSYWAEPAQVNYGYGMPMHVGPANPMMEPPLAPAGEIKPPVKPVEPKPVAPKPNDKTPATPKKDAGKKVTESAAPASVIVTLPADAILYANGTRTQQSSAERHFITPTLEAGMAYQYVLTIEMVRDGQTIRESREVEVQAGAEIRVNFNATVDAAGIAARE